MQFFLRIKLFLIRYLFILDIKPIFSNIFRAYTHKFNKAFIHCVGIYMGSVTTLVMI